MLLFAEGFDDFSTAADLATTAAAVVSPGVLTVLVVGRSGSGKALFAKGDEFTSGSATWLFNSAATVIAGLAIQSSAGTLQVQFLNESNVLFTVQQITLTGLDFLNSTGTVIGTAIYRNWSSYVEVKLTPGSSGSVIVRVDGIVVFTASGNFGAGPCNSLRFIGGPSAATNAVLDDLYVCDTTGTACNDFLGDTRVLSVAPMGDGADQQWTPDVAGPHFSRVNETPLDYDASYVGATAAGVSDTFTFPALAAQSGMVISAVQVRCYAKTDSGGVDKLAGIARVGGTDYAPPGGDQFVHAVYTGLDSIFALNPQTGLRWTLAEVNASEFGAQRTV